MATLYMKTLWLIVTFALAGCTSLSVPRPPAGAPAAQLNDRVTSDEDGSNPRVFAVLELDGVPIKNAIVNSGRVGFGAGTTVVPYLIVRHVEIKSYEARIAGQLISRAPIESIFREVKGQNFSIEGVVSFLPKPDHVYRVNGQLGREGSAVWIEDFETGEVVSQKLHAK